MPIQTASEEKLSLMSSLSRTWGSLSNLPEDRFVDRWDGLQLEVEGSTVEVERIADNVQRLGETVADKSQASKEIQSASVKLSDHIIRGTNIIDRVMGAPAADARDAAIAQEWAEAIRFVDDFCQDNQKRIHAISQSPMETDGPENSYYLGLASGSLGTAGQVARQQYERGIRMSLQGPLAEYAAASAMEMGLTHSPSEGIAPTGGAVYGVYRAMHQQYAIIERLPDLQLTAIQIDPADKPGLSPGKLVAFTYGDHDAYIRRDPAEFADECSIKAGNLREMAAHQDDGEAYRRLQKEAVHWTILSASVHAMDTVVEKLLSQRAQEAVIQPPARTRAEIVSGAVGQMNQAFGYTKADAPANGAAFHLDGEGTVVWDRPREQVRLASSGYSILPVIHYGPEAAPWICMEGERPTNLLVEHHGKAVVEFPASDTLLAEAMVDAMAYVENANATSDSSQYRAQRLTHAFHMGMLDRLDSSGVHGPEVDDVRNDGLSATVLALVKDANANTFAIIEADEQHPLQTERPRPFAIPVADEDVARLTVGESASFLMLDWREHCTVLKQLDPSVDAAGHEAPRARQATEAGLGL